MLSGNSGGGRTSAGWGARCMYLVLLLEFYSFSFGTAIPSSKENVDQMVAIDLRLTAPGKLESILNSDPALQEFEVHSTSQKDPNFPEVVGWGSHLKHGLLNVLQRFIAQFCRTAILDSWLVEGLDDHNRQKMKGGPRKDHDVPRSNGRSRRLLLRGPGNPKRRSSSPTFFWAALDQQEQITHNEGRRVLAETASSSEGIPVTQQVLLGPPAPPDLVHNEKQDWNQDYAEPDVHPPSSN